MKKKADGRRRKGEHVGKGRRREGKEKGERRRPGAGGANFKNGYHNTMGKKRSIEAATTNDNTIMPNLEGSIG